MALSSSGEPHLLSIYRCFIMNWSSICFWISIILLSDAAFGFWNHDRFSKMVPKVNIFKVAVIETGVATVLMIVHYFF